MFIKKKSYILEWFKPLRSSPLLPTSMGLEYTYISGRKMFLSGLGTSLKRSMVTLILV